MAIRFYDEALVTKIQKWVKDPNMHILRPDETTRLFQMKADEGNDKPIQLPLIAISRDRDISILKTVKEDLSFNGIELKKTDESTVLLNAIPIQIGYQLDIYTKGMVEADEYVRNFVFNFINYPELTIDIPYNDTNVKHTSNIYIDSTVSDNSDINERLFPDQFVRFTIKLVVDDAYLFSTPVKTNTELVYLDFQAQDKDTKEVVDSSVIINKTE